MKGSVIAALFVLVIPPAGADIFADFTVSSGGSELGTFRARLDHDKAPRTCANFIGLATGERAWIDVTTGQLRENTPFYDGLIFHRLIHDFVIQGGSSNGQGTAGSGYVIQDEFHPDLRHSGRYFLSMAKGSDPGSGNSQFFITLEDASFLDDKHAVFGEVIDGRDIIDGFTDSSLFPTGANDRPLTEIRMDSVSITGPDLNSFDIHDPALELPTFADAKPQPARDAEAETFTTTFHRKPKHDYAYSLSTDLTDWAQLVANSRPLFSLISLDDEEDFDLAVGGISGARRFATIVDVDYSFLQNPTAADLDAGRTLTFTAADGQTLTLVPDGSGGGTWSDSLGGSGTLSSFVVSDQSSDSGFQLGYRFQQQTDFKVTRIPLLGVSFELDGPGGMANRTSHSMTLDFRDADAGWSDGSAGNIDSGTGNTIQVVSFRHLFSVNPAP